VWLLEDVIGVLVATLALAGVRGGRA